MKAKTQVALGSLLFVILTALGNLVGSWVSGTMSKDATLVVQAPVVAMPLAADATAVDAPGLASPSTATP